MYRRLSLQLDQRVADNKSTAQESIEIQEAFLTLENDLNEKKSFCDKGVKSRIMNFDEDVTINEDLPSTTFRDQPSERVGLLLQQLSREHPETVVKSACMSNPVFWNTVLRPLL